MNAGASYTFSDAHVFQNIFERVFVQWEMRGKLGLRKILELLAGVVGTK